MHPELKNASIKTRETMGRRGGEPKQRLRLKTNACLPYSEDFSEGSFQGANRKGSHASQPKKAFLILH